MLVPELFSRMWPAERDAKALVEGGYLEKLEDYEYDGKPVLASRLGYRMNMRFATQYFGRLFLHPDVVFTDEILRPEIQDEATFAESMDVIVTTHQVVAQKYFNDGTIALACPPLKGLLEIMANGKTEEGWVLSSPEFRSLFDRETVLASDWYQARLDAKQAADIAHLESSIKGIEEFKAAQNDAFDLERLDLDGRIKTLQERLSEVRSEGFRQSLVGTIGRQVDFSF